MEWLQHCMQTTRVMKMASMLCAQHPVAAKKMPRQQLIWLDPGHSVPSLLCCRPQPAGIKGQHSSGPLALMLLDPLVYWLSC